LKRTSAAPITNREPDPIEAIKRVRRIDFVLVLALVLVLDELMAGTLRV